jgi:protein involved in polysaccharide export with SLBB domain
MKIMEDNAVEMRTEAAVRGYAATRRVKRKLFAGARVYMMLLLAVTAAEGLFADPASPATEPAVKDITNQVTTNVPVMEVMDKIDPVKSMASIEALDDKHTLALGDRLSFRIVEDGEGPKEMVVMDSGEVEVPYIGRFKALGLTCRQLAKGLKAELEKEYYYQATPIVAVDVLSRTRGKIYLVGAVHSPGPQEIPSDEVFTLSKAIMRAGGLGDYSDGHNVRITRKGEKPGDKDQTIKVDVEKILDKGKREGDIPVEADDLIYIPERLVHF